MRAALSADLNAVSSENLNGHILLNSATNSHIRSGETAPQLPFTIVEAITYVRGNPSIPVKCETTFFQLTHVFFYLIIVIENPFFVLRLVFFSRYFLYAF